VKKTAISVFAASILALGASLARADVTEHGKLLVAFNGGIAPAALPRGTPAPIAVSVGGTIKSLSGESPPALRKIEIALNRGGHLDNRGLPVCHLSQIQPSSKAEALKACAPALVGGGSYVASTAFPEGIAFPSQGRILVFNTVIGGQPAIFAYAYGNTPVPTTRVIVFRIHSAGGTYGTVLTGLLPATINRHGYLTSLQLSLHRNFIYHGRPRTYLSATCAAPAGFPGATFPFARVSMSFDDGRNLGTTLVRSCKVRGAR